MLKLSDDDLRFAETHSDWGQYRSIRFVLALIKEIFRLRRLTGELRCRDCRKPMNEPPFTWRSVGGDRSLIRHDFEDGWRGPRVAVNLDSLVG